MRKLFMLLSIFLLSTQIFAQKYIISGGAGTPYAYGESLSGTNIEQVYLLNGLSNASIQYSSSAISVVFYRYAKSLADKQQISDSDISISSVNNTTTYAIVNLQDGYGYFAEVNGTAEDAAWIIDYSLHLPTLISIKPDDTSDQCEYLKLLIDKTEDDLSFYSRSGNKRNILRKYTLSYNEGKWDEGKKQFVSEPYSRSFDVGTEINISAPINNTTFMLKGDQFAEHFNVAKQVSASYKAVAVEGHIVSEKESAVGVDNENSESVENSAPLTVNYSAKGSDAVNFYTWYIYNKNDMDNYIVRYTDQDIKYTFEQSGDFVVKLEVANISSTCAADTSSVSLNIADWDLQIPNYFSPGGSANTEFKVSYKSILKFKCTVFNRWGVKIYEWNDPEKGWDGRHNGKYVNTGVYYCVVEYTASDGKKRSKSRDITVLRKQ